MPIIDSRIQAAVAAEKIMRGLRQLLVANGSKNKFSLELWNCFTNLRKYGKRRHEFWQNMDIERRFYGL